MPISLEFSLAKLIDKCKKRKIHLKGTTSIARPGAYKHWLILYGLIYHVTASITELKIWTNELEFEDHMCMIQSIPAAATTAYHPIFSTKASDAPGNAAQSQWQPFILDETDTLSFAGDVNSFADIEVLEW